MGRKHVGIGDVVQIKLPTGRYAYGRVLRDASVGFYRETTAQPSKPRAGNRHYHFVVGVYEDVLRSENVAIIANDPSSVSEEDWPPPYSVRDVISGSVSIYHHGLMRAATLEECALLEPAAVWDFRHIVDRLVAMSKEL